MTGIVLEIVFHVNMLEAVDPTQILTIIQSWCFLVDV
jgi:hypothetical protein